MATRSITRGSTPFFAVVGLLLFALVMIASTPRWAGAGPVHQRSQTVGVMTPGSEVTTVSTLPHEQVRAEHLPRLWPARQHVEAAPARSARAWPEAGSAAILGPQQPGHRAAGSRSPPLA
ncbi:hypothetical protein ACQEUU_22180 [Nonomuraea sp. CA-218870]|uniref:hypothetical protein n=1 Tax=Nonomuraea sp. CA-218870 TaxID=3239998 RepID=UPI003D8C64F5